MAKPALYRTRQGLDRRGPRRPLRASPRIGLRRRSRRSKEPSRELGPLREDLLRGSEAGAEVHGLAQLVEHLLEGGQGRDDVKVGDVAHVADAEDLSLGGAAAAV